MQFIFLRWFAIHVFLNILNDTSVTGFNPVYPSQPLDKAGRLISSRGLWVLCGECTFIKASTEYQDFINYKDRQHAGPCHHAEITANYLGTLLTFLSSARLYSSLLPKMHQLCHSVHGLLKRALNAADQTTVNVNLDGKIIISHRLRMKSLKHHPWKWFACHLEAGHLRPAARHVINNVAPLVLPDGTDYFSHYKQLQLSSSSKDPQIH